MLAVASPTLRVERLCAGHCYDFSHAAAHLRCVCVCDLNKDQVPQKKSSAEKQQKKFPEQILWFVPRLSIHACHTHTQTHTHTHARTQDDRKMEDAFFLEDGVDHDQVGSGGAGRRRQDDGENTSKGGRESAAGVLGFEDEVN